jgi:hypothetical protein
VLLLAYVYLFNNYGSFSMTHSESASQTSQDMKTMLLTGTVFLGAALFGLADLTFNFSLNSGALLITLWQVITSAVGFTQLLWYLSQIVGAQFGTNTE